MADSPTGQILSNSTEPLKRPNLIALTDEEYEQVLALAKRLGIGPMQPGEDPDEYWARIGRLISEPVKRLRPIALTGEDYKLALARAKQRGVGPMQPGEDPEEYWTRTSRLSSEDPY